MLQRLLSPIVDVRKEEGLTALPDVRLLVPGDDGVQHHQAAHAIEVHHRISAPTTCRTCMLGAGLHHRRADAGLRVADGAAAAPLGAADHAGRDGGRLVVFWFLFQTDATLGLGRVLRRRARSSASCSSASSGRSPTSSTTRARPSGCSGSSAAARRSAASPGRRLASVSPRRSARSTCCCRAPRCWRLRACSSSSIIRREQVDADPVDAVKEEKGVGAAEAFELLRESKHLQIIALVISFARRRRGDHRAAAQHGGAGRQGRRQRPTRSRRSWRRSASDVVDRLRHPGVADEPHPPLARHRLRADDPAGEPRLDRGRHAAERARSGRPALARVLDQSLRYTVDKTTREILFLPLPAATSS